MTSPSRHHARLALLAPLLLAGGCVSSPPPPAPWEVASAVTVADLDGDGQPDIVTLMGTSLDGAWTPGFVSVRLQADGWGAFADPIRTTVGLDPVAVAVGDLDGDGRPDLVVACHGDAAGGTLTVYRQDPVLPGHFTPGAALPGALAGRPIDVKLADLDGDGRLDLAVAFDGVEQLALYFQSASTPGTFTGPVLLDLAVAPSRLAAADLTGAARQDLVATTRDGRVLVLLHDTTPGAFLPPVAYPAGVYPAAVEVADLDGDGHPDLLVADQLGSLLVLRQSAGGGGTFLAAVAHDTLDDGSVALVVADLDGDGKLDVAVASYGPPGYPGSEALFFQAPAGGGLLGRAQLYQGYYGPSSIAAGRFNAAGLVDLVIADGDPILRYQYPTQPGRFQPPVGLRY
jgi:hypothetical protein